ncbi:MAG: hypothetical protein J5871_04825 [Bacteroidales bacterium]|nr:hypothetical protein [Bacteroidales bacterium]
MGIINKTFAVLCLSLVLAGAWDAAACTTALVSAGASKTGRPLVFKQRDTSDPYNVLRHVKGGKYAYTGIFHASDKAAEESYGGANDAGFAIINNMSYNLHHDKYGPQNGYLISKALAECATVSDFEAMVRAMPEPRRLEANFGVADATGAIAYFEVGDLTITRYDVPDGGWLVRSNFSISGEAGKGSGMARYETAYRTMLSHKGKFAPEDLIDGLGRTFYNALLRADMLRRSPAGVAVDLDFIPRTTTTSAICIEVPAHGEAPSGSIIWTAIGYTPCCYAVPVWVAAGDAIPAALAPAGECGRSAANELAYILMRNVHPYDRDAAQKYIDFRILKPILSRVRKAEKAERSDGRAVDKQMCEAGFNLAAVQEFNHRSAERFEAFRKLF